MALKKSIYWFRKDLRLYDNPALNEATNSSQILPLYILDETHSAQRVLGAASSVWLHHSLNHLAESMNQKLLLKKGNTQSIILALIEQYQIDAIFWNICYEPEALEQDEMLIKALKARGIAVHAMHGGLLWEPSSIQKKSGGNFQVFTPFYRQVCLQAHEVRKPLSAPQNIQYMKHSEAIKPVSSLELLPKHHWHERVMSHWETGEQAAKRKLQYFIQNTLANYQKGRDYPAWNMVSRLSPHLHWGEISPQEIWHTINQLKQDENTACFLREIGWREFCHNLLYYYPNLPERNLHRQFDSFPWKKNKKYLDAWKKGMTGYPIVDAGMRELWQTGFMHNRVRMITASFLVKNLMIHWREGEAWFWDCLVDADLANNSANWQWVAGCGADAAPFFRIFNPTLQGKKFDPDGEYIKKYIPEIAHLPSKYLHEPWRAGKVMLQTYPMPIVDFKSSRKYALDNYRLSRVH